MMKKLFFCFSVAAFASCNNATDPKVASATGDDSTKTTMASVTYPYEIAYSSQFEIGDQEQAKKILEIWKSWDNGDLASTKDHFADSVTMNFADGSVMKGTRDSAMASGQAYRNSFKSVSSRVSAIIPLKSTDKNENWVCVWGTETHTDMKGKVDSVHFQETWRMNSAGKTDFVYQYARVATPKKL